MDAVEEEAHHPAVRELFESRSEMHPALSESHEPGADIWQPLWDWVFMNDIFQCWQRDDNRWILRCVGRPGSGKVRTSCFSFYVFPGISLCISFLYFAGCSLQIA